MSKTITLRNLMLTLFLFVGIGTATSQIVTSAADNGTPGTLRNQIAAAANGALITFLPTVTNITLTGGQITIDKNITITGLTNVTVDGNALSRIFNITDGTVTLINLTLSNGAADNGGAISVASADLILTNVTINNSVANGTSGSGGAILVSTDGSLLATNSSFTDNRANRAGGAIEVVASTTTVLNNCTMTNNNAGVAPATAAPGNGGALHMSGNADVAIIDGTVSNNKAASEGGGLWNGAGDMTISGTTLANNTAGGDAADNGGGAIYNLNAGNLTITNAMIMNNTATGISGSGGGILNDVGATATISGTTISANTSNRAGGGIENNAGTVDLTNVILLNNVTMMSPGNGGGLHVTAMGTTDITGGSVTGNTAGSEGGGLWNGTGVMTIDGTLISANMASGAAADNGGGGIYNLNGGTLNIDNAMIMGNMATGASGSGGGILNDVGATVTITSTTISGNTSNRAGGGIENNVGTVNLEDVLLNTNTTMTSPGNGGGLHVTGAGTVTIIAGTVNGNMAGAEGGGLWNGAGTMTITGTTIDGNTATGALSDQGGGGIYNFNGGTLMISDAQIINNVASGTAGSGGGILNDVGSMLTVLNSDMTGNTAVRAGGAIEDNSGASTIILTNVTMEGNAVSGPPGNGGGLHITGAGNATITGGSVSMNSATLEGGGLWNGTGTMLLENVMISENISTGAAADDGGAGIFNNGGTLTANNITLTDNKASGTAGSGGGLLSLAGTVTITTSTITGNSANRAGGGIEIVAGTLNVSNSIVNENNVDGDAGTPAPGNGGALHVSGIATINFTNTDVSNNLARREGGGLWNQTGSTMTVTGSTIDSNIARGSDAAQGGAGIFNNGGTLNVMKSSITNNELTGALGNGAGIHVKTGTATVEKSTVSGNTAVANGGGIYNNAALTVNASTIADNNAAMGGGIANNSATPPTLKSTIVADNAATTAGSEDVSSATGVFVSQGFNLVETANAAAFTAVSTDIIGQDPMLSALALNGNTDSNSLTQALQTGSPAYNMGDASDSSTDQRNFAIFGGTRDIGAFEAQQQLATQQFAFANGKSTVVYPNPTSGTINIQVAAGFGNDVTGRVIDLGSGKVIMNFKAQSALNTIDLVPMATGLYIVQLSSSAGVENHKIMVKN